MRSGGGRRTHAWAPRSGESAARMETSPPAASLPPCQFDRPTHRKPAGNPILVGHVDKCAPGFCPFVQVSGPVSLAFFVEAIRCFVQKHKLRLVHGCKQERKLLAHPVRIGAYL